MKFNLKQSSRHQAASLVNTQEISPCCFSFLHQWVNTNKNPTGCVPRKYTVLDMNSEILRLSSGIPIKAVISRPCSCHEICMKHCTGAMKVVAALTFISVLNFLEAQCRNERPSRRHELYILYVNSSP